MGKNIKITGEINEKIKKKISNSKFPEEIKEFLNKMLLLEFDHIDESRPRVKEEYESYIKKYAKEWKGE